MVLEVVLGAVIVVDALEEFAVEVGPFLESIALAEHARRYAARYQRSLYAERAAAAEGVDEVCLSMPSAHHDDAGGQYLVERCCHALLAVAAAVQALAAAVEGEGGVVLSDVYVQAKVGVCDAHVGARPCALAELVGDGVLHLIGHELRVTELI